MLIKKSVYLGVFCILTIGSPVYASNLTNFNDPNTDQLISAFKNKSVHIVQFGDSHTAADVMTGTLRTQLQSWLGNGGMGWGMPMYFSGQRLVRYGYDNNGWEPISSRQQRDQNYTLGGLIATPKFNGATLTIKSKQSELSQKIKVNLRQAATDGKFLGRDAQGHQFEIEAPIKNNAWQTVEFVAQLPFTITASNAEQSAIGGWWAKNQNGEGAVVSALGINGAELSYWNRWNEGWQQNLKSISPELIIIAYGTNEAFNDNIDVDKYKNLLISKVDQIRVASPDTAIMIVSAPESLKNIAGQCGIRPIKLTAIQNVQYQVAQQKHTLYWNWQQAMGGGCSMKSWINQGLGRKDGVHFSEAGYQKLGQALAEDLLSFVGLQQSYNTATNTEVNVAKSSQQYKPSTNTGYASICLEGTKECKSISF